MMRNTDPMIPTVDDLRDALSSVGELAAETAEVVEVLTFAQRLVLASCVEPVNHRMLSRHIAALAGLLKYWAADMGCSSIALEVKSVGQTQGQDEQTERKALPATAEEALRFADRRAYQAATTVDALMLVEDLMRESRALQADPERQRRFISRIRYFTAYVVRSNTCEAINAVAEELGLNWQDPDEVPDIVWRTDV